MSDSLEAIRETNRKRWLMDWHNGLASCLNCDHEYINAQAILHNDEKSCPNCKEPENKRYYFCPIDGSSQCDC